MKSILLHIHRDDAQEARFQAAVDIVRAFEGHLTCLQATPFDTYIIGDPLGGFYTMPSMIVKIREDEEADREIMENRLKVEGINWDWLNYAGSAAKMLVDRSWLTDLIIVGASTRVSDGDNDHPAPPIAADVALNAPAPVLVMPPKSKNFDCAGKALVAWNGSRESSMALRSALPLLQMASSVAIVTVAESKDCNFPATEAATFLSRHGVKAEIIERPNEDGSVADVLRNIIAAYGPGYMVMGAYGHSRLRERILGGVTQSMLRECPVPLLLAH